MLARLALALTLIALSSAARADVPPPADWKDPCLEAGIQPGDDCIRCGAPEFKDRACYERAQTDGYVQRCRGWSYAMLCRAKAEPANVAEPALATVAEPAPVVATDPTPAPAKRSACAGGADASGALAVLVGLATWVARRRR
ncbi:MAG: hypothetical protein U1F43_16375 [Myxococcota bacterium]